MSHHIEIDITGPGQGDIRIDGKSIDCRRVSLAAGINEMTIVILEVPAAQVTVRGMADVVSRISPKGGT